MMRALRLTWGCWALLAGLPVADIALAESLGQGERVHTHGLVPEREGDKTH